jgi:hypothetical protein
LANPLQAARELNAAAASAGGALLEDCGTSCGPELVELRVGLLVFGRDPGVAISAMGAILARPEALCPLSEVIRKRSFEDLYGAGQGASKGPVFVYRSGKRTKRFLGAGPTD